MNTKCSGTVRLPSCLFEYFSTRVKERDRRRRFNSTLSDNIYIFTRIIKKYVVYRGLFYKYRNGLIWKRSLYSFRTERTSWFERKWLLHDCHTRWGFHLHSNCLRSLTLSLQPLRPNVAELQTTVRSAKKVLQTVALIFRNERGRNKFVAFIENLSRKK